MQFSTILRLASTCAMVVALSACVSGGGGKPNIGGGGSGSGGGTGSGSGTGGGSTGGGSTGGGSTGGGSTGGATGGSVAGLGAFRTTERHLSGDTPEVDRSPVEGSGITALFTARSGTTPPKGTITGRVSATGETIDGDYTGMMAAPADNPSQPTFSEEFYAEGGKQIRLFYRLGDITPEHVALISYNGSQQIMTGGVVDRRVEGHAVVGAETPVGNLPTGNAVVYNGKFTGQVASSSNGYNDGDASATVDFTGAKVTGRIWNPGSANPAGTPEINFSGDLDGSRFHATSITATKNGATTELGGAAGGTLVGGIFGPAGEELGAAVNTPEVRAAGNSDFFWVRGGIVAKKQ
jgi:hypothetical protein